MNLLNIYKTIDANIQYSNLFINYIMMNTPMKYIEDNKKNLIMNRHQRIRHNQNPEETEYAYKLFHDILLLNDVL